MQALGKNPRATNSPPALRQIKDLPGPRVWPLVGNALQVKVSRIHRDMEQWCQRYSGLPPEELMGFVMSPGGLKMCLKARMELS